MRRRTFVGRVFAGLCMAGAAARLARAKSAPLPRRVFGKTGVELTWLGQGGAKLAYLRTREAAVAHVRAALDMGVNYYDCARVYWEGHSEEVYGEVLPPVRKRVFITTKTHKRTRAEAEADLALSLKAMKTDYVDLWQMHDVRSKEDIGRIFAPDGAMEAFAAAKKAGKCRFIGFSAHYEPEMALEMLRAGGPLDTILMPLHAADPAYRSFEKIVLPEAAKQGLAIQAMKVFGSAGLLRQLHVSECLRYSLSLPVHAAVVGCSTFGHWEDNARALERFRPMAAAEMEETRKRAAGGPAALFGARLEYWKRPPE